MDKQQILEMAKTDPRFSQAVLTLENQIGDMPITGENLDELVEMLEYALNNPDQYPQIVAAAVSDDMVDPGDLPEQFDQVAIISLLVLLYGMQERNKRKGFARGGLASLGRHGDTMMAHINPREAEMLKRMGGGGTINPNTGYPEYFSLKKFLKAALPIALTFLAPGLGTAIGSFLGASGVGASVLGGAILGGATSAATGGDWKRGALMGGLGGGAGNYVGGAANRAMNLGLGQTGQAVLGGALVGGVGGEITGEGFGKGALQGGIGGGIGQVAGGVSGPTALRQGVSTAGQTFGNALTAGYDPKTAASLGALSGIATGLTYKPSDAVVQNLQSGTDYEATTYPGVDTGAGITRRPIGQPSTDFRFYENPGVAPMTGSVSYPAVNARAGITREPMAEQSFWEKITGGGDTGAGEGGGTGLTAGKVLGGLSVLSALQGAPEPVQQAVQQMSPAQQEYFNRPSVTWDWNKLQTDANASNLSLNQYMARNWPRITGGEYNAQPAQPALARGGPLSAIARFAQGAGSGRADTIDAKLSDGEYVIDAETVAMLGDGSGKEGARRLEEMRRGIRAQKGKALARGKISPNAKSPLSYIKGIA
jgi:hypothetical protein